MATQCCSMPVAVMTSTTVWTAVYSWKLKNDPQPDSFDMRNPFSDSLSTTKLTGSETDVKKNRGESSDSFWRKSAVGRGTAIRKFLWRFGQPSEVSAEPLLCRICSTFPELPINSHSFPPRFRHPFESNLTAVFVY